MKLVSVQKLPLIVFSTQAWSELWVSKHWISSALSAQRTVFYVEPPTSKRLFRWTSSQSEVRQIGENLYVIPTETYPYPYRMPAWLRPLWRRPIKHQIQVALDRFRVSQADVLCFDAHGLPVIRSLSLKVNRLIYYAVDPPLGTEDARWPERRLIKESDYVLAVTDRLADLIEQESGRPVDRVLPHAIHVPKLSEINRADPRLPEFFRRPSSKRPVIGYTGAVHEVCVDFEVLAEAARRRPNWEFVFIGPVAGSELSKKRANVQRFSEFPNVTFCGPLAFDVLQHAIAHFDVCIVPYDPTRGIKWERRSPFKVLHYFAQGKAVVMSKVPATSDYDGLVYPYEGVESFINAIECGLKEPASAKKARIDFAMTRDFSEVLPQISSLLS